MTAGRSDAVLSASNVSVSLGGQPVLHAIDFEAKPGELIAVVGPNGAGKSTLLRTLAGLARPEGGAVTLEARTLADFSLRELARRIAYLPQDRIVHWSLDVAHVVGLGRLPYRSFAAAPSANDRDAVIAAMERVDVMRFAERPIATLSGGERARVLLARALAQGAQFLIADEPTAGLDPAHTLSMFAEFERLAYDSHGVIAAIHDLSLAARFATRVVILCEGRCIASGPPAQVLSTSNLKAAFHIDAVVTKVGEVPVVVPRAL